MNASKRLDIDGIIQPRAGAPGTLPRVNYDMVPSSEAVSAMYDSLDAHGQGKLARLPELKRRTNRKTEWTVQQNKTTSEMRVNVRSKSYDVSVQFPAVMSMPRPIRDIFLYVLTVCNAQHISDAPMDFIEFPVQDLVDRGAYKSARTASAAINKARPGLAMLLINGENRKTKKQSNNDGISAPLFTFVQVKNGTVRIGLNPVLNWDYVISAYVPVPRFYYALPDRAQVLLIHLCTQARQNLEKIKDEKPISVKMSTIAAWLLLPDAKGCNTPSQLIRDPIERSIEAIEDAQKAAGEISFIFSIDGYEIKKVSTFLENAYLTVKVTGKLRDALLSASSHNEEKITQLIATKAKKAKKAKKAEGQDKPKGNG